MELTIKKDTQDLDRLEGVIEKNISAFYEVGRALIEIRDRELYKIKNGGEYQTFEAYCKGAWDLSRPRAYQLIDAAGVQENLSTVVDKPIPERQARPLAKLEPERQREAWQKAVETAPAGKVTAAHICKVIKGLTVSEVPIPQPKKKLKCSFDAVQYAARAISELMKISGDDPRRKEALIIVSRWINKNEKGVNA